jgi:Bacteriophage clamp loader A subunit
MVKAKKQDTSENVVYTLFGAEKIKQEEVETKVQFNPFKFTQDINYDKQYLFDETTQSHYSPWLINTSFSMFPDTLSHAVFLNSNAWMEKQMQHDYLFYAVSKRKRFKKDGWFKKSESEKNSEKVIEDAAAVFNYSIAKMKQAWNILTDKQKEQLIETYVYPDYKNKIK